MSAESPRIGNLNDEMTACDSVAVPEAISAPTASPQNSSTSQLAKVEEINGLTSVFYSNPGLRMMAEQTLSLQEHPGRGIRSSANTAIIIRKNDKTLLNAIHQCFSLLAGYFHATSPAYSETTHDIPLLLLDMVVDICCNLKNDKELFNSFAQHRLFCKQVKYTLRSVNVDVKGNKGRMDDIIPFRLGFRAGLKPWQQYLHNESPGALPRLQAPDADTEQGGRVITVRRIPNSGLAIMKKYMDDFARLAEEYKREQYAENADMTQEEADKLEQHCQAYQSNAMDLRTPRTYTSIHGLRTTIRPVRLNEDNLKDNGHDEGVSTDTPLLNINRLAHQLIRGPEPTYPIGDERYDSWIYEVEHTAENRAEAMFDHSEFFNDWQL